MVGIRGSGKPKPFQRKSITVSTEIQDIKKAWQDLDPRQVEVGDIILGKGLVVGLGEVHRLTDPLEYLFDFEMKNGTTYRHRARPVGWDANEVTVLTPAIRAFARVRG